ncbi:MAG: nitroreductase family protein [Candidatus Aminicenantes bacterium]|nr:nitroreductase family protein [Candidatus Aminicenantes bacterium]
MDVTTAVHSRRAYRSLGSVPIDESLILDLATHAQLAPSCFNNQPARFVFVFDPATLAELHDALSANNEWAKAAPLIIVAFSKKEDDCVIREREYHQFDVGLATGFLILRATELGLVAHPIAGYSPKKTREVLGIPDGYQVITLVVVGKKAAAPSPVLTDKQAAAENARPERLPLANIIHFNHFAPPTT